MTTAALDAGRRRPDAVHRQPGRVGVVALAAAGAGHLVGAVDHRHAAMAAVLFTVTGIVQLGLALAHLRRPGRAVARLAVVTTIVLLAAWGLSRSVGIAIGHSHGPEPLGALEATVVSAEVLTLSWIARAGPRRRGWRMLSGAAALSMAVAAVVVYAVGSPAKGHDDGHPRLHDGGHHRPPGSPAVVASLRTETADVPPPDREPCHGEGCEPHRHP